MQCLQRRPSGVWVARLVVPARLRTLLGRSEFIRSTGTHDLSRAKVLGGDLLTRWRRLLLQVETMTDHDEVLRLVEGSQLLAAGGSVGLAAAAQAAGLNVGAVLDAAVGGKGLFVRCVSISGHVVSVDALCRAGAADPGTDEVVIPSPAQMPESAVPRLGNGALRVCEGDAHAVANALKAGKGVGVVALAWASPGMLFVPDVPLHLGLDRFEVDAGDVDRLRLRVAAGVPPERVEAARALRLASMQGRVGNASKKAGKRLSEALAAYVRDELPRTVVKPDEIKRQRDGIHLLIEFMGDVQLGQVDADFLRRFLAEHVSRFLAHENRVRLKHGTHSMRESIDKIEELGLSWSLMSAAERDQRMAWIARMFGWLHRQGWIDSDPATAVRGGSVMTALERKKAEKEKKPRTPFAPDELAAIFSVDWFQTGRGPLTAAGKSDRSFQPFLFWLPLLGLFGGFRIGEACQLWLNDVRQTPAGTWYIDVNDNTDDKTLEAGEGEGGDKSLKTAWSARKVPLHSELLEAGFIEWCEALRRAGYRRVFPELSWNQRVRYAKEPKRALSQLFERLGMARDGTKVFHSFRHNFNTALERLDDVKDTARKRLLGHLPGEDVNARHYTADREPDESVEIVNRLSYPIPSVARFDVPAGLAAVAAALDRKLGDRRGKEDIGVGGVA